MKSDLLKIGTMSFIAALLFIFNPVQDNEINAKLAHMCIDNPQMPCEDVVNYCEQSLKEGHECYIIN